MGQNLCIVEALWSQPGKNCFMKIEWILVKILHVSF